MAPAKNRSNLEQTTQHSYSHYIYLLSLILGLLFTVKRFDFHPVFTLSSPACAEPLLAVARGTISASHRLVTAARFPPEKEGALERHSAHEENLLFCSIRVPIGVF